MDRDEDRRKARATEVMVRANAQASSRACAGTREPARVGAWGCMKARSHVIVAARTKASSFLTPPHRRSRLSTHTLHRRRHPHSQLHAYAFDLTPSWLCPRPDAIFWTRSTSDSHALAFSLSPVPVRIQGKLVPIQTAMNPGQGPTQY